MTEAIDRLEVKIIAAEDLVLLDSALPSPYVEVVVGPDSKRTKAVTDSNNPEWNAPTMIFDHIVAGGADSLLLFIKHYDLFTGKDIILGSATIPLATALNAPITDIDDWYSLVPFPGMTFKPSGQIRLIITYFNVIDEEIAAGAALVPGEISNAPNLLQVTVIDADFTGTSIVKSPIEAFVVVQIADLRKQSSSSRKSLNPIWNEVIDLPVTDGSQNIEIIVKQTQLLRSTFLGRVRISMNEVAASGDIGVKKSYALVNENFEFLDRGNGNLNLSMVWIYDAATEEASKRRLARQQGIFSSITSRLFRQPQVSSVDKEKIIRNPLNADNDDDDEDEDELTANLSPQELAQYLEDKRRKRSEEIEKYLEKADYDDVVIKEGDYAVQVHIIEASDVKGYNASGLSDIFCVVEIFGQKQKTRVIKESSQAFFDETFYFNFKDVKREQLAEGSLKVTCYDHNWIRSNDVIGHFQVDLQSIYTSPDHELYRHWASLRNPANKDDITGGATGNVKFSCTIIGPGDSPKVHDPFKEEDDDEKDLELKEGTAQPDFGEGAAAQSLQFMVVSILKADGLPGYDRLISQNGLYAYAKLEFGGVKPIKTSKIFVTGKKNLSVSFEEELWIPVWLPTMCRKAKLTIWNREFGRKDLLLATAYVDFDSLSKLENDPIIPAQGILGKKKYNGPAFQWLHLYGANPLVRGNTQAANFMNKFPSYGSAYRGSLLVGTRLVKYSNGSNLAHVNSMDYDIPESFLPKQSTYLFRVMIYQGSDFGSKGQQARGKDGNYALGISIGPHEVRSAFRPYVNGAVDWLQLIELPSVPLPSDLRQIPDTIVTVYRGSESSFTSVAFTRFNTIELLPKLLSSNAAWYEFNHDQSHKSISTLGYPGAALLKMALVNSDDVDQSIDWEPERKKLDNKKPYCLRVFIYQARGLPAVDDNGMIDPYIKVRFSGQKKKTQTRSRTLNPTYYEVLSFDTLLPQDLTLAPNILVQVWDSDVFSRSPIAALRCRVADLTIFKSFLVPPPTPQWRPLSGIDGKQSLGEVLCSFQLFEKRTVEQVSPPADSITPALRKAFLDVHILGLRDLTKNGTLSIRKPFLQFDVAGQTYGESFQFGASRTPSPINPNFLDRHMTMISLPEDPLYTPTMEVKIYDESRNPLSAGSLLGVANISLLTKLPWNGDEYIPPRQHTILEDNLRQQRIAAQKRATKAESAKQIQPQQGGLTAAEMSGIDDGDTVPVRKVVDNGLGIFPVDDTAREPGSKYNELPVIMDDVDVRYAAEKKRKLKELRLKKRAYARRTGANYNDIDDSVLTEADLDNPNLVDFDETSNLSELKRIIGIPTSWASTDFLTGREWWTNSKGQGAGGNLENYLQTYPFENYEVYRGHVAFNKFGKRKDTKAKVGLLKAVIRVTIRNPLYDEEYSKFAKSIKTVSPCVLRLYVIKAYNLQPVGSFYNNKADPYVKVILGSREEKDLKTLNKRTLSPEFYSVYELPTSIPGPSSLKIQIFDHKTFFGSDVLMGETTIDCEDRFFHPKWTGLGDTKPLEARPLYKIGSSSPQGVVLLWLDILTAAEAANTPITKIAGPEKLKFEIRVICWRSKEVRAPGGGLKDFFATFYMEGDGQPRFDTDTHWRCKNGNASWNWRIKIPIELPVRARELGRLHIQLWDANIITSNEIIGETTFNLYDFFVLAYHRKNPVFPFKELKAAKAKQNLLGLSPVYAGTATETNKVTDLRVDDEFDDLEMDDIYQEDQPLLQENNPSGLTQRKTTAAASEVSHSSSAPGINEKVKTDEPAPAVVQEEEEDDAKQLLEQIQVFLGIGDTVAEDAEWMHLTYHDRKANKLSNRGKLAVSVSIVPESETKQRPVGTGRDEPNVNPYLPPPIGRFSFSFNPFSLINGLCGPKVLCIVICVYSCICIAAVFLFLSSYISGFYSVIALAKGG